MYFKCQKLWLLHNLEFYSYLLMCHGNTAVNLLSTISLITFFLNEYIRTETMKKKSVIAKFISSKKGKIPKKNITKRNLPIKSAPAKKVQEAKAGSQRDEHQEAEQQEHSIESINFDGEWDKISQATFGPNSNREKCFDISMGELDVSNVECTPATTDKSEPIDKLYFQSILSICKETLGRVKLVEKRLIQQDCNTVLKAPQRTLTQSESFLKRIRLPYNDIAEFNKFNELLEDEDIKDSVVCWNSEYIHIFKQV